MLQKSGYKDDDCPTVIEQEFAFDKIYDLRIRA